MRDPFPVFDHCRDIPPHSSFLQHVGIVYAAAQTDLVANLHLHLHQIGLWCLWVDVGENVDSSSLKRGGSAMAPEFIT